MFKKERKRAGGIFQTSTVLLAYGILVTSIIKDQMIQWLGNIMRRRENEPQRAVPLCGNFKEKNHVAGLEKDG